jgi:hypothetical protein
MLCRLCDLDSEFERDHNEQLAAIGAHDQEVGIVEPFVDFAEAVAPTLHLDAAINTEQGHGYIAAKASTGGTTKRNAFGGEAAFLQEPHDGTFDAVSLIARCTTAAHDRPPA